MLFKPHKVALAKVIEAIIYLSLLAVTAYCVVRAFEDYSKEKTYFSKSFEYVSYSDIPSVTLCMTAAKKLEYGKDFKLQVERNGNSNTFEVLKLGDNEAVLRAKGSNITAFRHIELEKFSMFEPFSEANVFIKSCFAIHQTPKHAKSHLGNPVIPFVGNFLIDLTQNKEVTNNITKSTLYFTTQQNSYGATMTRWFDGKAEPFHIERGKFHVLRITVVERFEYLNTRCSNESFYQCMSKSLKRTHKCAENCTVLSLPDFNYPECNKTETQLCHFYEYQKLFKEKICRSKQLCKVQDYTVEESDYEIHKSVDQLAFYIDYGEPKYSRGHRGLKPAIVIHTENLIINGFTLLGNVGGQMGMFIGFSFSGAIGWITGAMRKVWNFLRNKVIDLQIQ